jgi:hypothetical protein
VKNDLGYHVDVVLFADAQILRRVFIAFESLPELENISYKNGGTLGRIYVGAEVQKENIMDMQDLRLCVLIY